MSQENVERLRTAGERADEAPEAFFELFDADVEWITHLVDTEVTRGVDTVRRFFRTWMAPFAEIGFEWERMTDAGDEVVTITRWHGRGKVSGAPTEVRVHQVWTFREGKIVRYREYPTWEDALEAVGLRE